MAYLLQSFLADNNRRQGMAQVQQLHEYTRLYTIASLLERESFTHKMRDGWGLATDGKVLFGTDGTSSLYQMDPKSLQAMKTVT
ncbi:hypothetical protein BRADI_1g50732v3 [Brachypodium distachyon]|uniref:Uncharacterized protein n=1 Tax=Brachypodium distachyon TaxID=15368 RepID=A0A2K2DQS0_BRADI|nr:hypothetical protein BRADI_1g50732v3 [Brachypodium distachyon]